MDKIKLIKEIEHIALTYEFDEVVKDCTYEEFIEDWGKDVYECIYIDKPCPHTRDFSHELGHA